MRQRCAFVNYPPLFTETMDLSEQPTKKLIPSGQKRNGQERRGGRACDINYGKVEKRVRGQKTIGLWWHRVRY